MANAEHVARLQRGVAEWNSWRATTPGAVPDLSEIVLQREHFQGINLSGANLQGSKLRFCLFTDANFARADLRTAILRNSHAPHGCFDGAQFKGIGPQVNFSGSSFVDARFDECDLREVNFLGSDLSGAMLTGSNLTRAMFRRARLRNAQLTSCGLAEAFLVDAVLDEARLERCVFRQTVLAGIDLSSVSSLAGSRHDGPSHVGGCLEPTAIGLRLRHERQGAVESFLLGAGIPDGYMEAFRAMVRRPAEFYSCFISYNHSDAEFARRLSSDLQQMGIRCWLDEHAIRAGDDIYAEVDRGIRQWDKVLLCCSRSSLNSWWVERELDTAFEKERTLKREDGRDHLVIIPVDLDGYLLDEWNGSHAAAIRKRLAARFLDWQADESNYEKGFERLAAALRSDDSARAAPPARKL